MCNKSVKVVVDDEKSMLELQAIQFSNNLRQLHNQASKQFLSGQCIIVKYNFRNYI